MGGPAWRAVPLYLCAAAGCPRQRIGCRLVAWARHPTRSSAIARYPATCTCATLAAIRGRGQRRGFDRGLDRSRTHSHLAAVRDGEEAGQLRREGFAAHPLGQLRPVALQHGRVHVVLHRPAEAVGAGSGRGGSKGACCLGAPGRIHGRALKDPAALGVGRSTRSHRCRLRVKRKQRKQPTGLLLGAQSEQEGRAAGKGTRGRGGVHALAHLKGASQKFIMAATASLTMQLPCSRLALLPASVTMPSNAGTACGPPSVATRLHTWGRTRRVRLVWLGRTSSSLLSMQQWPRPHAHRMDRQGRLGRTWCRPCLPSHHLLAGQSSSAASPLNHHQHAAAPYPPPPGQPCRAQILRYAAGGPSIRAASSAPIPLPPVPASDSVCPALPGQARPPPHRKQTRAPGSPRPARALRRTPHLMSSSQQ